MERLKSALMHASKDALLFVLGLAMSVACSCAIAFVVGYYLRVLAAFFIAGWNMV